MSIADEQAAWPAGHPTPRVTVMRAEGPPKPRTYTADHVSSVDYYEDEIYLSCSGCDFELNMGWLVSVPELVTAWDNHLKPIKESA